jgi:hypothetical protein
VTFFSKKSLSLRKKKIQKKINNAKFCTKKKEIPTSDVLVIESLSVTKIKQVVLCIPNAGVFNPLLKY